MNPYAMDNTYHASTRHAHIGGTTSGFIDITQWGSFHSSKRNSKHNELVGGRTPINTETLVAYNGLRAFAGLKPVEDNLNSLLIASDIVLTVAEAAEVKQVSNCQLCVILNLSRNE